jgi:mono/diheme cytochrome c family protein
MRSTPAAALLLCAGVSLNLGFGWAAQAQPAESPGARSLYVRYCAECHGSGGHGDGPAASGLQPPPTDLTRSTLSRSDLIRVIDGRLNLKGHGAMPQWGRVFSNQGGSSGSRTSAIRVEALADEVLRLREGAAK